MIEKTFGERVEGQTYFERPGAYLICTREDQVAVVRTPKGYFLPGGGIEEKETKEECIHREVLEEIGYTTWIESYFTSAEEFRIHREFGHFHPIQYYYIGRFLEKVTEPIEEDHVFEWISTNDIEKRMYVKSQGWAIHKYMLELRGETEE